MAARYGSVALPVTWCPVSTLSDSGITVHYPICLPT